MAHAARRPCGGTPARRSPSPVPRSSAAAQRRLASIWCEWSSQWYSAPSRGPRGGHGGSIVPYAEALASPRPTAAASSSQAPICAAVIGASEYVFTSVSLGRNWLCAAPPVSDWKAAKCSASAASPTHSIGPAAASSPCAHARHASRVAVANGVKWQPSDGSHTCCRLSTFRRKSSACRAP